jgi:hypothetical protein
LVPIVSEDDNTNIISFQIEGHAPDPRPELNHLPGLDFVEANNPGNTVTDTDDRPKLFHIILSYPISYHLGDVHNFVLDHLRSIGDAQLLGGKWDTQF